MKKTASVLAMSALLIFGLTTAQPAQGSTFLLGMVTGAVLFGGDETTVGNSSNIIYTLPRASERVKDPLAIRLQSKEFNFAQEYAGNYGGGKTLRALFHEIVRDAGKFTILQVVRVFDESKQESATIWFAYTETSNVIPLEKLPPRKKPATK
ncbi:MAG: hypothetical protein Q8P76_03905 [bacterium]|nr:hypothetical protein [bacterium]